MRIIHLISGDLWAGAEAATFHLVTALQRIDDVECTVCVLNEGELARRLREAGTEVHVLDERVHGMRSLARSVRGLARDYDLVHAHRYKENLLAAMSGRPWVSTQHGRPEPFAGRAALRARLYRGLDLAAKRLSARRLIAVSTEVADWLARGVPRARIRSIANGIADPMAGSAPAAWSSRPRRVGFLGRLSPVKRPVLAVEWVAASPGVELEIVGDGPERASVEARIAALGVGDRVRLLGHRDDPLPLVARWRALLNTSEHEGHPISVLEAMALGTPVLAEAHGVHDALGEEIVGRLPPPGRDGGLAGLLAEPAIGEAVAAAVRRRFLDAFEVDATAARVHALYAESIDRQSERR